MRCQGFLVTRNLGHPVCVGHAWSGRAVLRGAEILHLALFLQRMLRLETLDDIDDTASSDESGDGGADSLRPARHDLVCEFVCVHFLYSRDHDFEG